MANKSKKRGHGKPDMNVLAYEAIQIATGQKKLKPEKKTNRSAVSLRDLAKRP